MTLPTAKLLKMLPVMLILAACSEPEDVPLVGAGLDGDIIFSSNRTGAWEVYIMDITEGDPVQLTDNSYDWGITPKFSPDGSKIYFSGSVNASNQYDIIIINRDGTNQINLTASSPESEEFPLMSPDGQQIVYTAKSLSTNHLGIIIMNSDGSNKRLLAENFRTLTAFAYSPAGESILCFGAESLGAGFNLFLVPVDGSAPTNLNVPNDPWVRWGHLKYSPDGQHIVFSIDYEIMDSLYNVTFYSNIFIMDANGANLTQLTDDTRESKVLDYAPDGTTILYYKTVYGSSDLMVMNTDGTNVRKITDTVEAEWHGGFIDNNHVVYEMSGPGSWPNYDYNIYIVDTNTSRSRQLTQDTAGDRRPDVFLRF